MTPSRALGARQGDRQSRAELLALMLLAAGHEPYLLVHGQKKGSYHLVVLRLDAISAPPAGWKDRAIACGRHRFLALPLEPDQEVGALPARLREGDRWTASIAVSRFEPKAPADD